MLEVADVEVIHRRKATNYERFGKLRRLGGGIGPGRPELGPDGHPAEPTATREPEPEPTPSGEICLAGWSAVFIAGYNDFGYVAFKHDDLCGHNSVRINEFKIDGTGDLAQNKSRLVADDKRYPAGEVGSMEAPCFGSCTVGPAFVSAMGILKFPNTPVCQ
ncbi:hypothetical protein CABS01_03497 [Colletotrichum abscissum]|uniref:uncharacterized protein n=1 Tax=Colletotrichum abscissum TaxID=1671311 RepID=UPI0027D4DCBD|nr:uncharacterized protein CABS01_03497 [Colletotrichum abscissum]KAK1478195.1 hypothetical protein CABS01_03497 [Colletotrichum abscissum]